MNSVGVQNCIPAGGPKWYPSGIAAAKALFPLLLHEVTKLFKVMVESR
jgi:hypothetical protein